MCSISSPRIFLSGVTWDYMKFMFDFKNCVIKILSNSASRHPIRLQGKLQQTEKEKVSKYFEVLLFYFSKF